MHDWGSGRLQSGALGYSVKSPSFDRVPVRDKVTRERLPGDCAVGLLWRIDYGRETIGGLGHANEKALPDVTAKLPEQVKRSTVLDPLRDDAHVERVRQVDS